MSEVPGARGLLLFLALIALDGSASGGWLLLGNWLAPAEQPAGGFSSCWGPEGAGHPAVCSGARRLGSGLLAGRVTRASRFVRSGSCLSDTLISRFSLENVGNVSKLLS